MFPTISGEPHPRHKPEPSVILFELNEADRHFLDKFIAAGKLPTFSKMIREGALLTTTIPFSRENNDRSSWRDISPWIIWPSIYSGLTPEEHGIRGFGQDPSTLRGKCIWDVLDQGGISTGVCGSLLSYPPRNAGNARFYVPESLADEPDCFPAQARAFQEFAIFAARNYSEDFLSQAGKGLVLLLRAMKSGVRCSTVLRLLAQVPVEKIIGPWHEAERAMLQAYMTFDVFTALYTEHRPRFASVHSNHVAYMQHRYWRAAEPERFADVMNDTDARFFSNVAERRAYELKLSHWIERSFVYTDQALARLSRLSGGDLVIVVATGLGQRPFDPGKGEIYNPIVRLTNERALFEQIGVLGFHLRHQMNPDLTVNFESESAAARAQESIAALQVERGGKLFMVQRKGAQILLELLVPQDSQVGPNPFLTHPGFPQLKLSLRTFVSSHSTNDQNTAQHHGNGWLLAWSANRHVMATCPTIEVTEVAPALLSLYGISAKPWMCSTAPPLVLEG